MIFELEARTPVSGGAGCHPLSPAVDHIDPGNQNGGFQIVCYALNDVKGHLPAKCFKALQNTDEWKEFMNQWKELATKDPGNRVAFQKLIKPYA